MSGMISSVVPPGEPDMGGPAWLTGTFAALMLTVAVYCSGRLVAARRWRRPTEIDADAGHVLMGVAMAGMLAADLRIVPTSLWEAVFGAGAAWFGCQLLRIRRGPPGSPWRCLHPAPHLMECAAMLYMFLVLPPALAGRSAVAGMGGMAASAIQSRFSFLALLLAVFMFGYVARVADRLTIRAPALALPAASDVPAASQALPTAADSLSPADVPAPGGCATVGSRPGRPYLAPRRAALCKIAMGITMGYMLILML
jgi:Domain of unknown function (DUF5134)